MQRPYSRPKPASTTAMNSVLTTGRDASRSMLLAARVRSWAVANGDGNGRESLIDSIMHYHKYTRDHDSKARKNIREWNNPPDSASSEITLNEEGNNAAIFRILEEVHQCPARHLRARDDDPLLPVYLTTQDIKQPESESAVHSFYSKPCLRPTEASCHRRWQRKRDRGRGEK